MKSRSRTKLVLCSVGALGLSIAAGACSSSDEAGAASPSVSGSASAAGATGSAGGASTLAGSSATSGNAGAAMVPTGGNATSGNATGGNATGGNATGGNATGGSSPVAGAAGSGGMTTQGGAGLGGAAGQSGGTGGAAGRGGTSPGGSGGGGDGDMPATVVNGCVVKMEGWAALAGTTGGGNATPQKVTSVDELRSLSNDDVPRVLQLDGTYDLGAQYLKVGSNKTFIGLNKNVLVKANGAGLSLRQSKNVIVRNFAIKGGGDVGTEGGDAVTATIADRLWFDHLTIMDGPDGILDLTQGTTNVTISWCKIYYTNANQPHRYAMQFSSGSSSGSTDKGKLDITMHHNWLGDLVNQRMPRHLWGRGHIYNSFYNSPGNEYCIGAGSLASLVIENNYFRDVVDPFRLQDDGPVHIVATGNVFDKATGKQETGALGSGAAGPPPGPWKPSYKYKLDAAKDVPDLVKRCSGPQ